MDHSMRNAEDVDISDKVTIKVKLADEGYHDLVIDWSDRSGKYKGKRVIDQLSTIIGIPSHYIGAAYINFTHNNLVEIFDKDLDERNQNEFTKENCLGILNDDFDCFAITTELIFCRFEFDLCICLESRLLVNDNDCTGNYCHYSNTRAFINRQVAIATNSELVMKIRLKYEEIPMDIEGIEIYLRKGKILRDFDIKPFIYGPWCRLTYGRAQEYIDYINPQYSRTRG
ncbi:uncharacterized protein LOC107371639 [Tetranychus urticae]|uniref:Uncharacterized protein n=1 Tax=Tetranychus urticae TaxID=32264 RepID=T1KY93_TETUR|nr:uncharacterized protein LOC107371639 [Tetranychus urticae]